MKNNIIGIIPARMASTRFPGKPLIKIEGIPMIHHVYLRSSMASILRDVYIATCDKEIKEYCLKNNINVVMTKDTHERATDRCAEAMLKIEKRTKEKIDIVVMIQGDEPMVYPEMIEIVTKDVLKNKSINIANLMGELKSKAEIMDPNQVKVVVDKNNFALYFSREPIPSNKKADISYSVYRQIAIIPFRRDFLIKFNKLKATPLEIIESVDMLRLLEHSCKVKMVLTPIDVYGVDTPDDLKKVSEYMKKDKLLPLYMDKRILN